MPMTDPEGNPIPADDPRLPTLAAIQDIQRTADKAQDVIEANGGQVGPLVDLEAQVKALVSLLVPPDEDNPMRRIFEFRRQEHRQTVLVQIVREMQEAAAGPRLLIPSGPGIPKDLRAPGTG